MLETHLTGHFTSYEHRTNHELATHIVAHLDRPGVLASLADARVVLLIAGRLRYTVGFAFTGRGFRFAKAIIAWLAA